MTSSNSSARNAKILFVAGIVAAAVVTASACSLTNLDPYTAGDGVIDTGQSSVDVGSDTKTDSHADSAKTDDGDDGADGDGGEGDSGGEDSDEGSSDTNKSDGTVLDAPDTATVDGSDARDGGDTSEVGDGGLADGSDSSAASDGSDTGAGSDGGDGTVTTDSTFVDTAPADAASLGDTGDAACPITSFGLSEIMVRPVAGAGDAHEWLELTNYGSCALDVGGVTLKIVSSSIDKADFTFPDGTMVAAGAAIVVADSDVVFKADVIPSFTLGAVFTLGKSGDVLVNGGNITVSLFGRGGSVAYEAAFVPSRGGSWPGLGRSYAYPAPSALCPATARLGSGGTLSASWKDTPTTPADQYGGGGDAGTDASPLYGTPTQPNTDIACP